MKTNMLVVLLLALSPGLAAAQSPSTIPVQEPQQSRAEAARQVQPENFVEGYYVPSNKIDNQGDHVDGNGGFGFNGLLGFGPSSFPVHPFLIGQYQQTDFKDRDQTVKDIRFGVGAQFLSWFGAYAEYADLKFNNTLDGLGVHVRFTPPAGPVNLMIQTGYLDLKNSNGPDVNGVDFSISGSMHFTPNWSAMLGYHLTSLSPKDDGNSLDIREVRVGARFDLGK